MNRCLEYSECQKNCDSLNLFSHLITDLFVSCRGKLDANAAGDSADALLTPVQSSPAASEPAGDDAIIATSQDSNFPSHLHLSPVLVIFDTALMSVTALNRPAATFASAFPAGEYMLERPALLKQESRLHRWK